MWGQQSQDASAGLQTPHPVLTPCQGLAGIRLPPPPQLWTSFHCSFSLQIQRNAYSIFFDEKFSIPLDPAALEEKSLRFSVFGIDEDERNVSTGVVELKLSVLDLPLQPFGGWLYLQDQNKVSPPTCLCLRTAPYVYTSEEGIHCPRNSLNTNIFRRLEKELSHTQGNSVYCMQMKGTLTTVYSPSTAPTTKPLEALLL